MIEVDLLDTPNSFHIGKSQFELDHDLTSAFCQAMLVQNAT